jgi:ABC-type transporter Mla subunit MlaD
MDIITANKVNEGVLPPVKGLVQGISLNLATLAEIISRAVPRTERGVARLESVLATISAIQIQLGSIAASLSQLSVEQMEQVNDLVDTALNLAGDKMEQYLESLKLEDDTVLDELKPLREKLNPVIVPDENEKLDKKANAFKRALEAVDEAGVQAEVSLIGEIISVVHKKPNDLPSLTKDTVLLS